MVKAPKVYVIDSGIQHFLLNIYTERDLFSHPNLGNSWEGYVINQIAFSKNERLDAHYYRTHAGAECDLVLARGHEVSAAIEIKYGKSASVSKGFYNSIEDLKSKNNFIITSGEEDYISKDGIRRVGLGTFIKNIYPKFK